MMFKIFTLLVLAGASFGKPVDKEGETEDGELLFPEEVPGLFEGDIELDGLNPFTRNAIGDKRRLWPNGILPYTISSSYSHSHANTFKQAMSEIERRTMVGGRKCIQFVPRTSEHVYINFQKGRGCHSPIGYTGRAAGVTLGRGCEYKGIAIHELLHHLGFFHEQSRPDRDSYVIIHWNNIQKGMEGNFRKYHPPTIDTQGFPYDYGSIMHYPKYAFAVDRSQPTIEPIRAGAQIGQRNGLSSIDVQEIQKLYGCR